MAAHFFVDGNRVPSTPQKRKRVGKDWGCKCPSSHSAKLVHLLFGDGMPESVDVLCHITSQVFLSGASSY